MTMLISLVGSQQGEAGGVIVARVGWRYLLGETAKLFGLTALASECDRDLYLNSIFFKAQTNQAETQNNVSTDSVQMRIIDFFPFFLHEQPMHRFTTFPFHLTLIFLSSMPSRPYVRSRLLKAHAIAYCLLKASTIF